ncbi:hypothetical protein [Paramicrobacterium agarici]|uniref:hypothetical protein n=1 Tax=Paramicrobacterium agarici TaxID=630514 RepID=UPI00114EC9C9|nr:hypothetical protein [Microbacterium agarici]TQO21930.1 hypothetical protein FB385_0743 [Microbacterium agarici]
MQEIDAINGRPVYVLGAGFSRAINEHMPLTDDLGEAIRTKLGIEWPAGPEPSTFEERLTLLSTSLPFLEGHQNTERRAMAEHTTAAIASELDLRVETTTAAEPPTWLLQLVSLWHAEQAVVITFNYDTLVEQATTFLRPTVLSGDIGPSDLHGWQIAFPSPAAVNVRTFDDMNAPTLDSLQLLKLHGSLNWYWALGEGATVVRDAAVDGFGSRTRTSQQDVAGVRLLDRFLVPPVTSKDSYYNVNLVRVIWRAAYEAIQHASKLTVMGYSMPPADRIAGELIRSLPVETPVEIVNWQTGSSDESASPLGRAWSLGLNVVSSWEGADSVQKFTSQRMDEASASLASNDALRELAGSSVVVAVKPPGSVIGPNSFTLRSMGTEEVGVVDLNWMQAGRSDMPPHEVGMNSLASGTAKLSDFFTGARLHEVVADGSHFSFRLNGRSYRMIDAKKANLGRWPILLGSHAPE